MKSPQEKARALFTINRRYPREWERVGGLASPSKMPGFTYGLPATMCQTGSKLAKIPGTVCHGCYALKGNYMFPTVQAVQFKRLASITSSSWVDDMALLIDAATEELGEPYFRWHDSGDIQSDVHAYRILDIAYILPNVQFWLPTKEWRYAKAFKYAPSNLTVRMSANQLNTCVSPVMNCQSSSVSTHKTWVGKKPLPRPKSQLCPAYSQGGECGDCRACWSPLVKDITYPKH